jgi:PAS domain S-box-containing protein
MPATPVAGSAASPRDDSTGDAGLDADAVRALVDAAPDGILLADERGTILFANRRAAELFAIALDDLVGRPVDDLLPERLREVHRAHRTRYGAEPRLRSMGAGLLLHARRSDGSEFPVEISLSPLTTAGGVRVVAVVRDVSERLETEQQLRLAEQHLHIVEDRERIARDLHDVVIQKLFAAGMSVQSVAARSTDEEHSQRLTRVVDDLDDTIREIRSAIFSLQSEMRDESGLRAKLLGVLDDERAALGFEPRIRFDGRVDATSSDVTEAVLAVVREAISNVARHARASSVEVEVAHHDGFVTVRVVDDGVGIPDSPTAGNGIVNLNRRAEKLGGECVLTASPGGGTVLDWRVPDPG